MIEFWVGLSITFAVCSLMVAAIYYANNNRYRMDQTRWRWFTLWITGPVWAWAWPVLLPLALLAVMGYGVYMAFFNKEVEVDRW